MKEQTAKDLALTLGIFLFMSVLMNVFFAWRLETEKDRYWALAEVALNQLHELDGCIRQGCRP